MNFITRNIPNSITCVNLIAGVMAIICATHADYNACGLTNYEWSYIFIAIAAVADFLDGFAARLLHAYSDLGKELDSLCDLVSFGVAPGILVYDCLSANNIPIAWIALLIPVCGALRLARFNIDVRQSTSFRGLPIPANAIFWIGFTSTAYSSPEFLSLWLSIVVILAESLLMVSDKTLISLKFKTWGWKGNEARWILIASAVVLVSLLKVQGLMWLIVFYYILSSLPFAKKD
jgi:CDP-diacylglycerol--serine O-phosphatidyltransferase